MSSSIPVEIRASRAPAQFAALAETLGTHRSIKHALDWLAAHDPPLAPSDMVTQDEFSHDIMIGYDDGLWLVYDVT